MNRIVSKTSVNRKFKKLLVSSRSTMFRNYSKDAPYKQLFMEQQVLAKEFKYFLPSAFDHVLDRYPRADPFYEKCMDWWRNVYAKGRHVNEMGVISITCDASIAKDIAADASIFRDQYGNDFLTIGGVVNTKFMDGTDQFDIHYHESLGALRAMERAYLDRAPYKFYHLKTDNEDVADWINMNPLRTIKDSCIGMIDRMITLMEEPDFNIKVSWIPRQANSSADRLASFMRRAYKSGYDMNEVPLSESIVEAIEYDKRGNWWFEILDHQCEVPKPEY